MTTTLLNGEHEPEKKYERKSEQIETELKFQLDNPSLLHEIIQNTEPIDIYQLYLSQPDEDEGLRLRRTVDCDGIATYEACLKSKGTLTNSGLSRLESTVEISDETFNQYDHGALASIHKLRFEPIPGVHIDLIDGVDLPHVEIESIFANKDAYDFYSSFKDVLVDITDQPSGDNETLAYASFDRELPMAQQKNTDDICAEILTRFSFHPKNSPLVITISGRSGSGKSTTALELTTALKQSLPDMKIASVSTDDYHRGKAKLELLLGGPCENWDSYDVYDTNLLAFDIWELAQGRAISQREFSFRSQEVELTGEINPADIVIIEGIAAQSPDLDKTRHLHFDIGTPLATCLGRDMARIRQDTRGNGGIGDQLDRMRYIIEIAEPTFRAQERLIRNPFSASTRPLGTVALREN